MNYPQIAAAELLETHGDRLFLCCWSMLRSRETAQTALRDTLLAAPAPSPTSASPSDTTVPDPSGS